LGDTAVAKYVSPNDHSPKVARLPNAFAVPAVIVVLLAALFGGATVAGREVTQLFEEVPQHEANLREKARFLHFELARRGVGKGLRQRCTV
jgi:hypothetical protein